LKGTFKEKCPIDFFDYFIIIIIIFPRYFDLFYYYFSFFGLTEVTV